jgi:hypothetical protein
VIGAPLAFRLAESFGAAFALPAQQDGRGILLRVHNLIVGASVAWFVIFPGDRPAYHAL